MNPTSPIRPNVDAPLTPGRAQTPGHDIDAFRADHSPNVRPDQMNDYIRLGNQLMQQLAELPKDGKMPDHLAKPESVVAIMWALTNQTAEKGQLYISGAMRVDTGIRTREKAEQIEKFFIACGQGTQPHTAYPRISTHMKENLAEGQKQWGIDIKDGLPAGKRSVLFAPQPDGTLFIKMEAHGCPPFWESGFRTFDNFKEFVGHSTDFITTRFDKPAKSHSYEKRKEHFPEDLKKEYQKTLDLIFPEKKQSFFQKIASFARFGPDDPQAKKKKEFEEVGKGGIDAIYKRRFDLESARTNQLLPPDARAKLERTVKANNENSPEAKRLLDADNKLRNEADLKLGSLINRLDAANKDALRSAPDYKGDVKGNEVLLMLQPKKNDS